MKRRNLLSLVLLGALGFLLLAAKPIPSPPSVGVDLRVVVDLSAAQIRSLATAPITAIPAPGAGKVIWPKRVMSIYTFVTTPYDSSHAMLTVDGDLAFGNVGLAVEDWIELSRPDSHVSAQPLALYNSGSPVNPTNKPITIVVYPNSPGSAGDGTLRFIIDYEIVTL